MEVFSQDAKWVEEGSWSPAPLAENLYKNPYLDIY
jgi:hypothetical protein